MERTVQLGTVANHCTVAATVLYLYDTMLTFSDSVELIWCRKITSASALYILNRYLMLPWIALQFLLIQETDCARAYIISQASNGILCSLLIVFAALSAIRVYSLNFYGFDWKLPGLVTSFVLFQFGTSVYEYSRYRSQVVSPPLHCTVRDTVPANLYYGLTIAVRVLNIIHDALILLFTWHKIRGELREHGSAMYMRNNIVTRLLLNGAVYFIVHFVLNILDAVLTVTGTFNSSYIFNQIFTPLILSHFFLSIREAHYARNRQLSSPSQISDPSLGGTQPLEDQEALSEGIKVNWGTLSTEGDYERGVEDIEAR